MPWARPAPEPIKSLHYRMATTMVRATTRVAVRRLKDGAGTVRLE